MKSTRKILWFSFVALMVILSTGLTIGLAYSSTPAASLTARIADLWRPHAGREPVSMLFTGDIMLGRYINTLRERRGGTFPFTYMPDIIDRVEEQLGVDELDLVVGNLEGPITDSNYRNPGTAMIFNFKPQSAQLLADSGFTTLSMANNHTLDMGTHGPQQTHDYLDAVGIDAFGHPNTPNGPYTFETYGFEFLTIGFLGFNDAVYPLDEEGAIAQILARDPQVDVLIVSVHWGIEYEPQARQNIVDLAHRFADAGADLIIGHHPHVIQNSEIYNGVPIYYSLGNFVFDQYFSRAVMEGLVVGVRLDDREVTTTELYVDLVNQGEPKPRQE